MFFLRRWPSVFFLIALIVFPLIVSAASLGTDDLKSTLKEKRQARELLEARAEEYLRKLNDEQKKGATLKRQLIILEQKQRATEAAIGAKKIEIEEVDITLEGIARDIAVLEESIRRAKQQLGALLLHIHVNDERGSLEMLFAYSTFSDFFERVQDLEELERDVSRALKDIQGKKENVEAKKHETEQERTRLAILEKELLNDQAHLQGEASSGAQLLAETKNSESRYQALLAEEKQERERVDAEIRELEATLRARIAEQLPDTQTGTGQFTWPINPAKGISTYFRDPTYPYRQVFEHEAIDIPIAQGSVFRSAADGVVGRAFDAGLGYSYIIVLHANGMSTLYAHVSRIDVNEGDPVIAGQQLGLTGGQPGTRGAGRFTTGPHLHLEFRRKSIPVDPLQYLP